MAIHTQQSVSGFIATEPQLTYTAKGDARFYARIGQEHYRREADGSFTELEPTFHDLVAYRATAERAYERLQKGDSFVAEGYAHTFEHERDGQTIESEEFVAKKIGHNLARTTYEVDRARRAQAVTEREAPANAPQMSEPRRDSASASPALGL